jgi:hypothetical protein
MIQMSEEKFAAMLRVIEAAKAVAQIAEADSGKTLVDEPSVDAFQKADAELYDAVKAYEAIE